MPKRDKNFVWPRADARSLDLKGMKVAIVGGTSGIWRALSRFLGVARRGCCGHRPDLRDSDVPGTEFIKADLSLMREALRIR